MGFNRNGMIGELREMKRCCSAVEMSSALIPTAHLGDGLWPTCSRVINMTAVLQSRNVQKDASLSWGAGVHLHNHGFLYIRVS